jgi:hypothetical protein
MEDEQNRKSYQRIFKGGLGFSGITSGTTTVVTATPVDGKPQSLGYDVNTPSIEIAHDGTSTIAWELEPEYIETISEIVERSKWLGRGIKFSIEFLKLGKLEIETKPTREAKKTNRIIWRRPPHE